MRIHELTKLLAQIKQQQPLLDTNFLQLVIDGKAVNNVELALDEGKLQLAVLDEENTEETE